MSVKKERRRSQELKTISRFSFGKPAASVGHLHDFSVELRKFSKREALTAG